MKVIVTDSGVVIGLSKNDQATVLEVAHPTKYTTRQLLEAVVQQWTSDLYQDLQDAVDTLNEVENA